MASLARAPQTSEALDLWRQQLPPDIGKLDISTDHNARAANSMDRWPEAMKWSSAELSGHLPAVVVRPTTTEQVAAVVAAAHAAGVPVVARGAGSGVVGSVVNEAGYIALDLSRLTEPVHIDQERGEVTVPAGMLAIHLEKALNSHGLRLPHYPQSLPLASIGGLVATRSSGTFSTKYGNVEDFLVAVEVVLADGTVISTRATPRSSTGPQLSTIFVGSEGTLGVITAVTLRVLPEAAETRFRGVAFPELADGLNSVKAIMDGGITPAVVRLYDPQEAEKHFALAGLEAKSRCLLVLGFDGHERVVAAEEAACLSLVTQHHGDDLGPESGEAWFAHRFDASWLDEGNDGDARIADAIEVSAPWPQLTKLHKTVLDVMNPYVDRAYAHYSHFYSNGGAVYFIFFTSGRDTAEVRARYRSAWEATLKAVLDCGGSISHHHGVGEMRKAWMEAEDRDNLLLLRRIKSCLDPQRILSPCKLGIDPVVEG